MRIDDLLNKSKNGEKLSREELVYLLGLSPVSADAYLVMAEASRISKELTDNRAEVHAQLALNLAHKAKNTGQSMTLEPMPADERRIVHLALSVNPEVTTQSDGEGDVRRVIIRPKRR